MSKILYQIHRANGNAYIVEGKAEIYSEEALRQMIKQGEVFADIRLDGSIDTTGIMVIENIETEDITDLPEDLDYEILNTCKKIRRLATLDRVRLDQSEHNANNGLNTHGEIHVQVSEVFLLY